MDADKRQEQEAVLPTLVEGVRLSPGFVRGFWSNDVDEPGVSLTFIVFETLDQAREFRKAVIANAPAQAVSGVERSGIRIVEIRADA